MFLIGSLAEVSHWSIWNSSKLHILLRIEQIIPNSNQFQQRFGGAVSHWPLLVMVTSFLRLHLEKVNLICQPLYYLGYKTHIPNIDAISGALFTLRIQHEYTQTQCHEGARDIINIRYMGITISITIRSNITAPSLSWCKVKGEIFSSSDSSKLISPKEVSEFSGECLLRHKNYFFTDSSKNNENHNFYVFQVYLTVRKYENQRSGLVLTRRESHCHYVFFQI